MKAVVLTETGVPPVDAEFDEPVAGEGQVVVEMAAAAIHHVDLARASGSFYLGPPPLPSVLGSDGVGRLPDGRRVFVDSAVVPSGRGRNGRSPAPSTCSTWPTASTTSPPPRWPTPGSQPGSP